MRKTCLPSNRVLLKQYSHKKIINILFTTAVLRILIFKVILDILEGQIHFFEFFYSDPDPPDQHFLYPWTLVDIFFIISFDCLYFI